MTLISKKWKALPAEYQAPFHDLAKKDKDRYSEEVESYFETVKRHRDESLEEEDGASCGGGRKGKRPLISVSAVERWQKHRASRMSKMENAKNQASTVDSGFAANDDGFSSYIQEPIRRDENDFTPETPEEDDDASSHLEEALKQKKDGLDSLQDLPWIADTEFLNKLLSVGTGDLHS